MNQPQVILSKQTNRVKALHVHPLRPWIILALHSGQILIWDITLHIVVRKYQLHKGPVRGINFHQHLPLFVSGGDDFSVIVWNFKDQRMICQLIGHVDYIRSVQFHNLLPWVISASDDQTIRLWNYQSRTCVSTIPGHSHYVMSALFHPNLQLIISASLDGNARLWSYQGYTKSTSVQLNTNFVDVQIVKVMSGHQRGVNWACFHPSNNYLASGSDDKTIRLWKYSGGVVWHTTTLNGHTHNVCSVMFQNRLDILISCSQDRSVRFWNYREGQSLGQIKLQKDRYWNICMLSSAGMIGVGHDNGFQIIKLGQQYDPFVKNKRGGIVYGYGEANDIFQYYNQKQIRMAYSKSKTKSMIYSNKLDVYIFIHPPSARIYKGNLLYLEQQKVKFSCFWNQCVILYNSKHIKIIQLIKKGSILIQIPEGLKVSGIFSILQKQVLLTTQNCKILEINMQATKTSKRIVINKEHTAHQYLKQVITSKCQKYAALLFQNQFWLCTTKQLKIIKKIQIENRIISFIWDQKTIFFYSTLTSIQYGFLSGKTFLYSCSDKPKQLIQRKKNLLLYFQPSSSNPIKQFQNKGMVQVDIKYAIQQHNWQQLIRLLKQYEHIGDSFNSYLNSMGLGKLVQQFIRDPQEAFDMALQCNNLQNAIKLCQKINSKDCWQKLSIKALGSGQFAMYEASLIHLKQFQKLSFLYLLQGNKQKLQKMLNKAKKKGNYQSIFNNSLYSDNILQQINVLNQTGYTILAQILAQNYNIHYQNKQLDSTNKYLKQHGLKGLTTLNADDSAWAVQDVMDKGDIIIQLINKQKKV